MERQVCIDFLPESGLRYRAGWTVVAIDVIRATTMAITAAAMGRRCYPVATLDEAWQRAGSLPDPLLAGELAGDMPAGFHLNNSPSELAARTDTRRPLVMLSSSGTKLMVNALGCDALYLACFRNSMSTARHVLRGEPERVALLGAGSRGEFREEDQICCAWIGAALVREGYVARDGATATVIERWGSARPSDCLVSHSIGYLRRSGQLADLDFILDRIDDLDEAYLLEDGQVVPAGERRGVAPALAGSR